jgi:hypothetical protein
MKGIAQDSESVVGSRQVWPGLLLAGGLLLGFSQAEAAPIRHRALSRADASVSQEWSNYLLAGPAVWVRILHPPVTPAIRSSIWESIRTDPGGADPMVHYLLWKQGLDPERFAHFHPKLAPALTKLASPQTSPQQLLPPPTISSVVNPTSPTESSPVVSGEFLNPPAIAEPGTILLALGMAGWCVWQGRRHRPRD